MKNQKGFTLIELLVTLGLAGIVVSLVMSFFISNLKSYDTINTISELQYESQNIINFMTNKVLECENVKELLDTSGADVINNTGSVIVSKVSFAYEEDSKSYGFIINENEELIYIENEAASGTKVGSFIEELKITSIPSDESFLESRGIKINLKLKNINQEYSAEQTVYMRNHE